MDVSLVGLWGSLFTLLLWGLPIVLLVWFIRTLTAIARSLHEIADRLSDLERAVRDRSRDAPPDER
jgi:cytochrome c-type biogenesis protein CcmH/NrfF